MNWNIWNGVIKAASSFGKGAEQQSGETRQQQGSGNTIIQNTTATPTPTPIYQLKQQSPSWTEQCCPLYRHVTSTPSELPERITEEFTDSFQKWGELVCRARARPYRDQGRVLVHIWFPEWG